MPTVPPSPRPKNKLDSLTNRVSIFSPIIIFLLTFGANAVGIPVPPGLLDAAVPMLIGSVVQSAATWKARNRPGGGGATTGRPGIKIPG